MRLLSIASNQIKTHFFWNNGNVIYDVFQIILGFIMTMSTTTTKRVLKRSRSDFEPSSTTPPSSRQQRRSTTSPSTRQPESNKENDGGDVRKRKQKDKESSRKSKSSEPVGRKRGYFRFKDLPIAIGKTYGSLRNSPFFFQSLWIVPLNVSSFF